MAKVAPTQTKNGARRVSGGLSDSQRADIERLAFQYFLERGGDHGHDQEDWLKAEAVVRKKIS